VTYNPLVCAIIRKAQRGRVGVRVSQSQRLFACIQSDGSVLRLSIDLRARFRNAADGRKCLHPTPTGLPGTNNACLTFGTTANLALTFTSRSTTAPIGIRRGRRASEPGLTEVVRRCVLVCHLPNTVTLTDQVLMLWATSPSTVASGRSGAKPDPSRCNLSWKRQVLWWTTTPTPRPKALRCGCI
jgi:hypothetical protein